MAPAGVGEHQLEPAVLGDARLTRPRVADVTCPADLGHRDDDVQAIERILPDQRRGDGSIDPCVSTAKACSGPNRIIREGCVSCCQMPWMSLAVGG